jgi:hypothetical protein
MSKRSRIKHSLPESEAHPIVWFSALLRGVESNDPSLVHEAQACLERLGYFVVPYPPKDPDKKGVA